MQYIKDLTWFGRSCNKMVDMMESEVGIAVLTQKVQEYAQTKYALDVVVTLL